MIFASDGRIPSIDGVRGSNNIGIVVLYIVSTTITSAVIMAKDGARGSSVYSLARHHIAKLGTATVFSNNAIVYDHIDIAFHNLVIVAISLGHDSTTIELAYQGMVDAPSDIARNTFFISCSYGTEAPAINIAMRIVDEWFNFLVVTTSEVERTKIAAKCVDGTMARRVGGTSIDMGTWCERRHNNMTTENNIRNMLVLVRIFISSCPPSVLVIDAAVEDDRTIIASLSFKLELPKADESGFRDLEVTTRAETSEGEEISGFV